MRFLVAAASRKDAELGRVARGRGSSLSSRTRSPRRHRSEPAHADRARLEDTHRAVPVAVTFANQQGRAGTAEVPNPPTPPSNMPEVISAMPTPEENSAVDLEGIYLRALASWRGEVALQARGRARVGAGGAPPSVHDAALRALFGDLPEADQRGAEAHQRSAAPPRGYYYYYYYYYYY